MTDPVKKKCLYCGYVRQPEDETDFIPASECPKCRTIYAGVERWHLKKEHEEEKKREIAAKKAAEKLIHEQKIAEEKSKHEQKMSADYQEYVKTKTVKSEAMSYETFKKVYKEREEYEKTHPVTSSKSKSYTPKCPTCGSGNIEKISVTRKIFFLGPFFPMYGKTFKCKNCGYKW